MATKRMLVDASHPEETRIVVTSGNKLDEFDFESANKRQLRGNIYLAKVTRVEPSLQAAFIDYGGNRHGFLAFSEIHPDYYQIPVADREVLLRAEAEANAKAVAAAHAAELAASPKEEVSEEISTANGDEESADASDADTDNAEVSAEDGSEKAANGEADDAQPVEIVAGTTDSEEGFDDLGGGEGDDLLEQRRKLTRRYKIQEVIKRRQVLLVQVVKEERGNKGAALTTYLSLAGRYSVLMPNTARGGGISRKITSASDRKRLKQIAGDLTVPAGMGVILRTAGASRTKAEIKRDFEYLSRLWENVRQLTMQSAAPSLVYEEGSLIKRTIRDLYNKEIGEVLVAGDKAYREAKDFMRLIMPSHAKVVQAYKEDQHLFTRFNVESQLDSMFSPQVTLPAGGYLVINPTEALVSIDVNSGRATKEHNIENTALQTNLEAADEVARQLRLRDLAGLIVIDFIDMTERRSIRAVEKRMKDALKNDRARIQVGRISHFGLLEMSRQRMRFGVLESSTSACPTCAGTGIVRAVESSALMVMRAIEDHVVRRQGQSVEVRMPSDIALYILNAKRALLIDLEKRLDLIITISADNAMTGSQFSIDRSSARPAQAEGATDVVSMQNTQIEDATEVEEASVGAEADESVVKAEDEATKERSPRKRRRGRRGGRRNRRGPETETTTDTPTENGDAQNAVAQTAQASGSGETETSSSQSQAEAGGTIEAISENGTDQSEETQEKAPKKTGRRRTRRKSSAKSNGDNSSPSTETSAAEQVSDKSGTAAPVTNNSADEVQPAVGAQTGAQPGVDEEKPVDVTPDTSANGNARPARKTRAKSKPRPQPQSEEAKPEAEPVAKPAPMPEEGVIVASSPDGGAKKPKRKGWWSLK